MGNKNILVAVIFIFSLFYSCERLLEPQTVDYYTQDMLKDDMPFAEGILTNALIINGSYPNASSVATDDAVSNENGNRFRRMATGEWTSLFNPVTEWENAYEKIYYLNFFLSIVDEVEWSWKSAVRKEYFSRRFKGEAYGLRAWHSFNLLQKHAGKSNDGSLLGYIILDKPLHKDETWKLQRNSFSDCIDSIYRDIDRGIALLPMDYENTGDPDYDMVFGSQNEGRVTARILMALRSRVALFAASEAFVPSQENQEMAADAAASLLADIGGISGLSLKGNLWYNYPNDPEIIWRKDVETINSWEKQNYPPSLFGLGRTNPTQNLVDAFPMQNGYPISDVNSNYDPQDPYNSRDPRLSDYIVFNRSILIGDTIYTDISSEQDGLNQSVNASRTGYYLRKFMNPEVNLSPEVNSTRPHFLTLFRYTEIFLNYAEAANEAWGPNGDPRGYGYTPAEVIGAIRKRGGMTQPDLFLGSISNKDEMRELIRNERRIELCFEGFRFWDLRRWNMDLNEMALGASIANGNHSVIEVEPRSYKDYMIYGPIPYNELLRNELLIQNASW